METIVSLSHEVRLSLEIAFTPKHKLFLTLSISLYILLMYTHEIPVVHI